MTQKIFGNWMILIDASIQIGEKKCLLIIGCRQNNLARGHPLALEDLEILGLRIVSSLNATVVTQLLNEVASTIGNIVSICSDRGSEMLRGIKDFQKNHPETRQINDTAHRIANLLESTLERSTKWKMFREQVTQSRRRMQNSLISGLLPPSPRAKARYMNVGDLIVWAADMLLLMDNPNSIPESNIEELKKYAGWLLNYREEVYYWNRIVSIGIKARDLVRVEDIHTHIVDAFEEAISSIKMGPKEMQFANEIVVFLLEQSKGITAGERFLGSTEVLESLFGKIKYMEHEQTAFGFTSLVLAAIAHVGSTSNETIAKAITSVKLSDVDRWSKNEIGKSVQSQRRQIKNIISQLRTEMGQELSGCLKEEAIGF